MIKKLLILALILTSSLSMGCLLENPKPVIADPIYDTITIQGDMTIGNMSMAMEPYLMNYSDDAWDMVQEPDFFAGLYEDVLTYQITKQGGEQVGIHMTYFNQEIVEIVEVDIIVRRI